VFNLVEFRDCLERAVSLLRTCGETEKVSGLNGTAAWGARIYGDGRRTGDSPDRFGRVMLADSTGEQHASRMKGVGRFP
jgi:hypothetical protein